MLTDEAARDLQPGIEEKRSEQGLDDIADDVVRQAGMVLAGVGQGAFVKAGVSVGAGAIIGARATVLRDVPPYAIVVGTPARVVRLRFPELVAERLLGLEWWRYSIYDLFGAPFDDIGAAIDRIEELVARGAVLPYEAPVIGPAELADAGALAASLAPPLMARAS